MDHEDELPEHFKPAQLIKDLAKEIRLSEVRIHYWIKYLMHFLIKYQKKLFSCLYDQSNSFSFNYNSYGL